MPQLKTRQNTGLAACATASLSETDRVLCDRLIDFFQPLAASAPML
ncbi:MAG: hypothetical protein MZU97_21960 [Bacillus subtilis]|nr:hypothetical protein [Bacillus subtilis]